MEKRGEPLELTSGPGKDANLAPQHQRGNHRLFGGPGGLPLEFGQGWE